MIKIANLLDFPFDQGPSTYQSHGLPLSARTVHHHPEPYQATVQSYPLSIPETRTMVVKQEPVWNNETCPNVEIRNGTLCVFDMMAVKREDEEVSGRIDFGRGTNAERRHESEQQVTSSSMERGYCGGIGRDLTGIYISR